MIKFVTIIGARPQIIKAAAISRAIKNKFSKEKTEVIVHTGQHYDQNMSEVFFQELDIPKTNYNLKVGSGKHGVPSFKYAFVSYTFPFTMIQQSSSELCLATSSSV